MRDAFLYVVAFVIVTFLYFLAGVFFAYAFNAVAIDLLGVEVERINWLMGMAAALLLRGLFVPLGVQR